MKGKNSGAAVQVGSKPSSGYNTNLASEFYVLSVLYRLGADASLTLGNKKSVDIVIARAAGDFITVDVKAVAGRMDWPTKNHDVPFPDRHFLALLCYNGRFSDPDMAPAVWIVPYAARFPFLKPYKGGTMYVISRALLVKQGGAYKNAWEWLHARP